MSWQNGLILVGCGLAAVAIIIPWVMYARERSRRVKAAVALATAKGDLAEAVDDIERLMTTIELKGLSDEELAKRLRLGLQRWRPAGGNGSGVGTDGAGGANR